MKSDLDRAMEERGIDAIFTLPTEHEDPYRAYLTNGAKFHGMVVKKRGEDPILIANLMEVDEAAKSGYQVLDQQQAFGLYEIAREHAGDFEAITAAYYRRIFEKLGITGKVTAYGVNDVNTTLRLLSVIGAQLKDLVELVPDAGKRKLFDEVVETKDDDELARLRRVAAGTSATMRATREWIASHRAEGDTVVKADGSPLTIGEVKRFVRGTLFEHGLEDSEGMIFSQGRDAAFGHSRGEDDQPLTLGQSIVFDLFPREPGGYFHDVTRTWSIGHASDELQQIHAQVMEAYKLSSERCKPGTPTHEVQIMVCEFFEDLGHPSGLNSPGTTEGYYHSLAHGLGLQVHEPPYFRNQPGEYVIQVGNVFTIEPGLYYADKGYGVRIEDTVYVNPQGEIEVLTDVPYDLVIELKG